jgi:hypothetical protein
MAGSTTAKRAVLGNAEAWTLLWREGYDVYRDLFQYRRLSGDAAGCGPRARSGCRSAEARFDFATALMSPLDMPQPALPLREACWVLKPGGFLQFSIAHSCFNPPYRRLLRDRAGQAYAVEEGGYFSRTPTGALMRGCSRPRRKRPKPGCGRFKCRGSTGRHRDG